VRDRDTLTFGLNIENSTQDRMFMNFASKNENIPFDFPIYTELNGSGDIVRQVVIPAADYSWNEMTIGMRSGSQRKLSAFLGTGTGEYYDGTRTNIRSNVDCRPSERLRLRIEYSRNVISLPDGDFTVRLSSLQTQLVFSSTLSWVNLIQYDNVSETIGLNSRLHWIPQAGREGFIVFNHSVSDPEKNDSFHSTYADVSVKFSYTFRF
jgi:hypothetical protein